MKKFLIVALMLAVSLIFYQGTANAYSGVWDKVPGTSVVIPFFCDKDGSGENTLWSIAALTGVSAHYWVYDVWSDKVYDNTEGFTNNDVQNDDCLSLAARMSAADRDQLSVGDQYQGYIVYTSPVANNLIAWSYMVDLSKGFAASGIVFEAENAMDAWMCEYDPGNGLYGCVTAQQMYPRYYIHNGNPESTTNWIFLVGDYYTFLSGVICNTDEDCPSGIDIEIIEVSKVDIRDMIPDGLFTDYPKSGFAILDVSGVGDDWASIFGISHQKAQANTVEGTWDVTHEIHRNNDYTTWWE